MNEIGTAEIEIGMRFLADENFGTVRYVGPVLPTEDIWIGVEWDDVARGKHDGTHGGVRYFNTSFPTSGSFLRPKKADFGRKCSQAILEKYCGKGTTRRQPEEHFIIMKNSDVLHVDMVGMDKIAAKQSQLSSLREVSISNMTVSKAGQDDELLLTVPNIMELDISRNLFNSWEEVAKVARQLHCLKILNVSHNRLTIPDDPEVLQAAFSKLEIIILNQMKYSWQQILRCSKMWPQIKHMTVTFNNIGTIMMFNDDHLSNLEYLDLEGNSIKEWGEILKLGNLQRLKQLNLKGNGIENIHFAVGQSNDKTSLFSNLEILNLQNNNISRWSDINELNKLPKLNNCDLQNNPVWTLDKRETVWQIIIAKIAGLEKLNRCNITPKERRDAELDYLKKYGKEWLEITVNGDDRRNAFSQQHPRYSDLVKRYGAVEESELKTESSALKSSLLKVRLYCPQVSSKPLMKQFPGSMTIQKLRGLIQRLFKLEKEQTILLKCASSKNPDHVVEMTNDLRELSFYIENDDQILVALLDI